MAEDVFGIVGSTQAGSFRVERPVAEGGFGVVYRAQHGAFRAPVALKCLKVPASMTAEQREAFLEKFREEAELLFRLSASIPEVVRPLQFGLLELPGQFVPFLALEWLEGQSLLAVLEERRAAGKAPMALHKLMKLLTPIAKALARAHRFPGPDGPIAIIHRDLKPDNIFLAESAGASTMKILDFGIAKVKSATSAIAGHSTAGDVLNAFTPSYGAPEQWLPKRFGQAGPWTDVWGMAITMVEALAGRCPIDGELAAMMATTLDEKRRPTPRNEGVVVALEVEAAFARALAVDPRDRTKDIETLWTEIETALGLPRTFAPHDRRRDSGQMSRANLGLSDPPPPVGLDGVGKPPAGRDERRHDALEPGAKRDPRREDDEPVAPLGSRDGSPAASRSGRESASRSRSDKATLVAKGPADAAPPAVRADNPTAPLPLVAKGGRADAGPGSPARAAPSFDVPDLVPAAPAPQPRAAAPAPIAAPDLALAPARPAPAPAARPAAAAKPAPFASDAFDDEIEVGGRRFELAAAPPSVPSVARTTPRRAVPESAPPPADLGALRARIRGPAWLVFGAVAISVADLTYTRMTGVVLVFEGLRPIWVAAPLVLVGVGLGIWRLLGD